MKKSWLILAAWAMLAAPASAYPTSLISVPTADILEYKALHFGLYTYTPWDFNEKGGYDLSINLGLFEGFQLGDLRLGALEVGVDATHPESFVGSSLSGSFKLGLLSETDFLPGMAVGSFYRGLPSNELTPNFNYLALTKSFVPGGFDLGSWTIGAYQLSKDYVGEGANTGFFAGATHDLGDSFSITADTTSGQSGMSGSNIGLSFSPTDALSISLGYFLAADPSANAPFLFLDYHRPFGSQTEE